MTREAAIRARALELGFEECRFTTADPPARAAHFSAWLKGNEHGEMSWLARTEQKRLQPQLVLPGARSIVALSACYAGPGPELTGPLAGTGYVAAYARQMDYHHVLGERLETMARFLDELGGAGTRSLWYTDTGPVLERDLAERAGLGFIGKHTNLISRTRGNWLLLGEILTTLELQPDLPEKNRCGTCTRCLAACPTGAITAPFRLDARLCVSYLTIELKGPIPVNLRPAIGRRIFGCDDCLAACPWNRFAREGALLRQHLRPDLAAPDLLELLSLDEAAFNARFAGTPILRCKWRGLRRNVCVALGNVGDRSALPALANAAQDPDPLVAEHAAWAVEQVASSDTSHTTKRRDTVYD
jgi:epoxyqueuosine reductase